MSCNRKQLQIFGWSREVDNFWLKERISWKEIATVRLTMVELVEVNSGSSNGESFVLGICVRDGSVEWWRSAVELRFIIPDLSVGVCVRSCNPCTSDYLSYSEAMSHMRNGKNNVGAKYVPIYCVVEPKNEMGSSSNQYKRYTTFYNPFFLLFQIL